MPKGTLIRIALATAFAAGLVFQQAPVLVRAAPGDLDPTFGSGGVADDYVGRNVQIFKLVLQPDGKILVVGWEEYPSFVIGAPPVRRVFLRRYDAGGGLDLDFPPLPFGEGYDAEVEPDGKIVVVGKSRQTFTVGGQQYDTVAPTVWRFTPAGQPDTAFDGDGERVLGVFTGLAKDVELLGGKIYVGFTSKPVRGLYPFRYKVSRLSTAGATEGTVTPPLRNAPPPDHYFWQFYFAMNVSDTNGDVAVVGLDEATDDTLVLRYKKDGSPATSFGNNGKVVLPNCGCTLAPTDVLVRPDGKVLAFGWKSIGAGINCATLNRLNADGSSDFCDAYSAPVIFDNSVLIQPDGKSLFSARQWIFRHNADGTFDTVIYAPPPMYELTSNARALQPDAKIVSVGLDAVYLGESENIRLYRHLLD